MTKCRKRELSPKSAAVVSLTKRNREEPVGQATIALGKKRRALGKVNDTTFPVRRQPVYSGQGQLHRPIMNGQQIPFRNTDSSRRKRQPQLKAFFVHVLFHQIVRLNPPGQLSHGWQIKAICLRGNNGQPISDRCPVVWWN